MPFSFLDIANWARSRDFEQEVSKDSIYGFPTKLFDLANYLETGGQSGPMSHVRCKDRSDCQGRSQGFED